MNAGFTHKKHDSLSVPPEPNVQARAEQAIERHDRPKRSAYDASISLPFHRPMHPSRRETAAAHNLHRSTCACAEPMRQNKKEIFTGGAIKNISNSLSSQTRMPAEGHGEV
ncbi:hypothetical protein EVAR_38770_1 [Eumeta japonica]|uniref:Uncharacterized protein n=1 Tax=Eumeta variegata TaxID=151549 RepID=A0A4C1WIU2_EUMVA|nr:hypothetical protein EVAR_38770_1 [Eumeta japonica]